MLARAIATGLIGSVLLAGAAFAQSPTATSDRADMASVSVQGDWRTSKVVGLNVITTTMKTSDRSTIS